MDRLFGIETMNKITPDSIETYLSQSEEETFQIGINLAKTLNKGAAVSLEGDLGTGKTALAKGIARGLGIAEPITSPTFTIVNTYEGIFMLHHFDIYRLNDEDELYAIGWEEYFDGEAVCLVEWGDRFPHMLPEPFIRIKIERNPAHFDERRIRVERWDEPS